MKNADKPAFPVNLEDEIFEGTASHDGLTKRERFAMAAMQGMRANPDFTEDGPDDIAKRSAEHADALLKALEEE